MEITYEKESDSKYVQFKNAKVDRTEEINDWFFLDRDKEGGVLGTEILDASKHQVNLVVVNNVLIGFSFEEKAPFVNEMEQKVFSENLAQKLADNVLEKTLVVSY